VVVRARLCAVYHTTHFEGREDCVANLRFIVHQLRIYIYMRHEKASLDQSPRSCSRRGINWVDEAWFKGPCGWHELCCVKMKVGHWNAFGGSDFRCVSLMLLMMKIYSRPFFFPVGVHAWIMGLRQAILVFIRSTLASSSCLGKGFLSTEPTTKAVFWFFAGVNLAMCLEMKSCKRYSIRILSF